MADKNKVTTKNIVDILKDMRKDRSQSSLLVRLLENEEYLRGQYGTSYDEFCKAYVFNILNIYVPNIERKEIMLAVYNFLPGFENLKALGELRNLYVRLADKTNQLVDTAWSDINRSLRNIEDNVIDSIAEQICDIIPDGDVLGLAKKISLKIPQIIPSYESSSGKLEIINPVMSLGGHHDEETQADLVAIGVKNDLSTVMERIDTGYYRTKAPQKLAVGAPLHNDSRRVLPNKSGQYSAEKTGLHNNNILSFNNFGRNVTAVLTALSLCFGVSTKTIELFSTIKNELQVSFAGVFEDNSKPGSNAAELANNVANPDFCIKTEVRTGWGSVTDLKPGDKVEFQLEYLNTDPNGLTHSNVMIRTILPASLKYVPGTTRLWNELHDGMTIDQDDIVTAKSINIGNYKAGANAFVRFTAEVVEENLVDGSNVLVTWGAASVGDTILQDSARVRVLI